RSPTMPSKKIYVRPYEVKGHYRTIHTRVFKFICAHCDKPSKRETYATVCPTYGNRCNSDKAKCLRHQTKNTESQKLFEVNPETENKTNFVEDSSQKVQPTTPAAPVNLVPPERESIDRNSRTAPPGLDVPSIRRSLDRDLQQAIVPEDKPTWGNPLDLENIKPPLKKETKSKSSNNTPSRSTQQSKQQNSLDLHTAKLAIDRSKLIDYINQLLKKEYNKKLNSDEIGIVIDLWNGKEYDEIAIDRGLRIQALINMSSRLMQQLSNAIREPVDEINFRQVMEKHYYAFELIYGESK
ncbi:MAG: hypothetical protein ACFBSE_18365, partial [Prochloraceae cyanobacterium]